jgi:CheY-like chemotaxis protein
MLDFGSKQNLPTVLLIDDDMVSREVMATVLTMSGYTVHTAEDGDASLVLLSAGECAPDVVLMDAQMPGLSGTALIAQLRTRTNATVYAISGSHAPEAVVAAADGFLLKPFGVEALNRLLESHAEQLNPAAETGETPSQVASLPVVNAETLAQMRGMMPEKSVREIYAAVVADLNKKINALQIAIAQRDWPEIRRVGHSIKGGCGMAGAQQAARLGTLLEAIGNPSDAAQNGNHVDNGAALLKDLRAATRRLESMLEAEFPA